MTEIGHFKLSELFYIYYYNIVDIFLSIVYGETVIYFLDSCIKYTYSIPDFLTQYGLDLLKEFSKNISVFVMIQGICGAFLVRIPVAFLMQHFGNGSLFLIGLAIPCSTVLQIIMCFAAYFYYRKRMNQDIID